ncbi:MAG: hypothetical protein FJ304_14290 [Planctomycetes bacterium]|nr:hypothetical protein [Planctomycetota bacterium]
MNRFVLAATLAAVVGLGTASTADAQYVVRYNRVTPSGGVATTNELYGFGTYQSYNTYVSPFGFVKQQSYYSDIFGNSYGRAQGFNVYSGAGFNRGFYQPSPYLYPFAGGYNYNFYRR